MLGSGGPIEKVLPQRVVHAAERGPSDVEALLVDRCVVRQHSGDEVEFAAVDARDLLLDVHDIFPDVFNELGRGRGLRLDERRDPLLSIKKFALTRLNFASAVVSMAAVRPS